MNWILSTWILYGLGVVGIGFEVSELSVGGIKNIGFWVISISFAALWMLFCDLTNKVKF